MATHRRNLAEVRDLGVRRMRIALLSHSYHQVTGSADFLAEILKKLGVVETFFDETWAGRQADWVANFEPRNFDCITILQAHECFQYVNADHPNIVFVPMYDAMIWQGEFYWREIFNCAKVLCFSSALHQEVSVRHPEPAYFQYYPDPRPYPKAQAYGAPRGYYWRRTNEIDDRCIEGLTKGFAFEHFTLHDVPDPGGSLKNESDGPFVETAHRAVTGWHSSEETYLNHLSTHNIYFAPRLREGIGFGFLKAMAMGLCVVAPNTATHNEYIAQGCTGILYQPDNPHAVDLRRYREMGTRARDSIERGRRRWDARSDQVLEFFAVPRSACQRRHFAVDYWIDASRGTAPSCHRGGGERFPTVAVVTVCLNARNDIEKTIRAITAQDYPGLEYLIFDGGSTDGTVDVIRQYEDALTFWTSRPDGGVYPAMQQSLDQVKSEWVFFMNAGDFFVSADSLRRLFAAAPERSQVVYGHHLYRHASGVDELRLASDFGWMWSRLQEGEFDVEYPVGFPAHQATAVRTQLLRKLKFDGLFRIAADHDLLWRAWRHGAKFFHADEIVSVYVGGGFSARQFERCKQEWCVIALRYGPWRGAARFKNCTYADSVQAVELDYGIRSDRYIKRIGETLAGRIPGFGMLTRTAATMYLWAAKKLILDSPETAAHLDRSLLKRGEAAPSKSMPFTRAGITTFLSEARGLAEPEEWGAWSDGKIVELVFLERLPDSFKLVLRVCAFGPNACAEISVTVGQVCRGMAMKGRRIRSYHLDFSGHGGDNRMIFSIPYPTAPADLQPLSSADRRLLGLGFVSIRIKPIPATRQ